MSLVEAMGIGLPVVAARSGGVPFVVRDGVDGYLIDAGDVQALSQKLQCLVDDEKMRVQMGRDAWNGCKDRFSGVTVLKLLRDCYDRLELKNA
jgi:glycosyltransferase involved in cell wall biosynthesis